ncbi:hypothetical protein FSY45_24670 [Comamonas sp. Z1]|uniref:hypothetical protein n=1 Tax=Comamonas sp. Z1 TaxID=2601246 RepID=UPI0011E6679B|nr:hypothetical protein [Comamonas sp. Z1]TYK70262.1 hypothetical protein FSY45_24670 [Comamonas sp. Z1]
MARRYGRNQKRRHREQIAHLSERVESLVIVCGTSETKQKFAYMKLQELQAVIDRAVDLLGEGHISLPPGNISVDAGLLESGAPLYYAPPPSLSFDRIENPSPTLSMQHRLDQLLVGFEHAAWADSFHAYASVNGRRVGYAISRQSVERLNARALALTLEREIAPALAKHLAKALKLPPLHAD